MGTNQSLKSKKIFLKDILTVKDFIYLSDLERKIHQNHLWDTEDFKYIIALTKKGIRMLYIKHKNENNLYYCTTKSGKAIIPIDYEDMENPPINKTEYDIYEEKNCSLKKFVENLGKDDKIITFYNNFCINEYSDKNLLKILNTYLEKDKNYLKVNTKYY